MELPRPRPRPLDRSSLRMEALDALNNLEELGQAAEEDLRHRKHQQERLRAERLERLGGLERPSEVGRASKSTFFTSRESSRRGSRSSSQRPRRPSKETGGPTHSHSRTSPLDAVLGRSEKVNLGDLAEKDLAEASIAIEVDECTADSNMAQSSEGDLDSLPERQASQVMPCATWAFSSPCMQVLTTAPSPHRYVTMIVCFSLLLCQVRPMTPDDAR